MTAVRIVDGTVYLDTVLADGDPREGPGDPLAFMAAVFETDE